MALFFNARLQYCRYSGNFYTGPNTSVTIKTWVRTMSQYIRRMEAIPLDWNALTEQQHNAVEAVSELLTEALAAAPVPKARSEKPRGSKHKLHRDRCSQLAFIDGDRGTGKSSVLLTLQALVTEDTANEATQQGEPAYPSAISHLIEQRHHVVWLETLDMEPLSKGANLFAAILARIEQELDSHPDELPLMAAVLAESDGYAGAYDRLKQLQNDAAIVWDRIDGGAYGGDPQTRALWVNQAEKAGLEPNPRLAEVLEEVARTRRMMRKADNTLFVLPVDDFDLAPCHCLELLRLIRMVTTPRLFFLVAGNTRIAEGVLKLRTEGDLLSLTYGKPSSPEEVREKAVEIAANNMRKLLPPGQRVCLATLRIKEALNMGANQKGNSLQAKLDAIKFEVNQAPTGKAEMSLASFLLPEGLPAGEITIAEWLASTPRQALDRIEMFNRLAKAEVSGEAKEIHDDRLVIRLFEEIRREIREDGVISYALREKLSETFDTSASVSLDLRYLRVEHQYFFTELKDFADFKLVNGTPINFRVSVKSGNKGDRWEDQSPQEVTELHRRLGISLLFAHDFVASLWGGYLRHSPLTYNSRIGPQIEVRWKALGEGYFSYPWPSLEWWAYRDFDRLTKHWNLYVDKCDGRYGRAWLAALLEVVLKEPPEPDSDGLATQRLNGFLKQLIDEEPSRTARRLLRDSALVAVVLLFAPEYKTELDFIEFSRDDFDFFKEAAKIDRITKKVRLARAGILQKYAGQGLNMVVRLSDAQLFSIWSDMAPHVIWDSIMERLKPTLLERLNFPLTEVSQPLRTSEFASRARLTWTRLHEVRKRSEEKAQNNQDTVKSFDEYMKRVKYLLDVMSTPSSFFLLQDGAFVPTKEEIAPIQPPLQL
jgi:hypothetical protein